MEMYVKIKPFVDYDNTFNNNNVYRYNNTNYNTCLGKTNVLL